MVAKDASIDRKGGKNKGAILKSSQKIGKKSAAYKRERLQIEGGL